MRERLSDYQEKYEGELFNLEATPAESTAYRLAKHDRKRWPDIKTAVATGIIWSFPIEKSEILSPTIF